jgi:hypothetical protein
MHPFSFENGACKSLILLMFLKRAYLVTFSKIAILTLVSH